MAPGPSSSLRPHPSPKLCVYPEPSPAHDSTMIQASTTRVGRGGAGCVHMMGPSVQDFRIYYTFPPLFAKSHWRMTSTTLQKYVHRGVRSWGGVTPKHPNRATLYLKNLLYTSLCTGELNAIRKHNCFLCSPFYVKGVSLGYVGRIKTLRT